MVRKIILCLGILVSFQLYAMQKTVEKFEEQEQVKTDAPKWTPRSLRSA